MVLAWGCKAFDTSIPPYFWLLRCSHSPVGDKLNEMLLMPLQSFVCVALQWCCCYNHFRSLHHFLWGWTLKFLTENIKEKNKKVFLLKMSRCTSLSSCFVCLNESHTYHKSKMKKLFCPSEVLPWDKKKTIGNLEKSLKATFTLLDSRKWTTSNIQLCQVQITRAVCISGHHVIHISCIDPQLVYHLTELQVFTH